MTTKVPQWQLEIVPSAMAELDELRVFDRRRIWDAMKEQLSKEPNVETRNRKSLKPDPRWELRVGEVRVFYRYDADLRLVKVLHVRRKGRKTTGEVLS